MGLLYSNYVSKPVTNNSLNINAVSGTLTKTFQKSYFINFQIGSAMENFYFRENKPSRIVEISEQYKYEYEKYENAYYKLKEIVVLQAMLCSDKYFLVEAIDKEDYDKLFEIEVKDE